MRLTMNGYALAVEDGGQGTPVLLLHGFPMSSAIFGPIRPLIERAGRLVTLDLRGFGASDAPAGGYGMDELAEDVIRVADHLELERFVLGGHSMGGYVAFRVAASHRQRLSGLILIDTRAAADTPEGAAKRRASIAAIAAGGRDKFLDGFLPLLVAPASRARQPELMQQLRTIAAGIPDHVLTGCLEGMMTRPDSRDLLAGLDLPVWRSWALRIRSLRLTRPGPSPSPCRGGCSSKCRTPATRRPSSSRRSSARPSSSS
jgi:pimeloyl-ACP methyl ester carboxylesterase